MRGLSGRTLVAALCGVITACAARTAATQPVRIPFELREDLAIVETRVGGHATRLVLDSGSSLMALDSVFVDSARIPLDSQGSVAGARNAAARLGVVPTVQLHGIELTSVTAAAVDLGPLQRRVGYDVVGTLGAELFSRYVVTVDYVAREIVLHEPQSFSAPPEAVIVPLRLVGGIPIVQADITTRTRGTIPARLLVDLGSSTHALRVGARLVRQFELTRDTVTLAGVFGIGVGGVLEGDLLRLPAVQLGTLRFARPGTALSRETSGIFGPESFVDGTIGVPLLRRTRVTFDYARERLILEPVGRLDVADSVDGSGLLLALRSRDDAAVIVTHVLPRSPAARAGVQVGDEVVGIDDVRGRALSVPAARALLRGEGVRRRLSIARGPRTLEVTLDLRMPY